MTFKRQTGIRVAHSATVVNHLNQRPSGILHNHLDRLGSGINSILKQLLHHRSGALNHLAGGYLVGYRVRKKFDYITHKQDYAFKFASHPQDENAYAKLSYRPDATKWCYQHNVKTMLITC